VGVGDAVEGIGEGVTMTNNPEGNDGPTMKPVLKWIQVSEILADPVTKPATRWIPISTFLADDGISNRSPNSPLR
jgi:hypothetical protein